MYLRIKVVSWNTWGTLLHLHHKITLLVFITSLCLCISATRKCLFLTSCLHWKWERVALCTLTSAINGHIVATYEQISDSFYNRMYSKKPELKENKRCSSTAVNQTSYCYNGDLAQCVVFVFYNMFITIAATATHSKLVVSKLMP